MRRLFLLLAVLVATSASAQEAPTAPPQRVVLDDGTVLVGTVVDPDADPVVVVTEGGIEQRIPRARVVEVTDLLDGRFTRYDPARTRLFVSPTARSLGSGSRRFSAYYIFPSLALGVTDRVDLSVGTTVPLVSTDGAAVLVNGNAKVTLTQSGGLSTAVGGSVVVPLATGERLPGVGGTIYGLATIGGEAGAVTVGAYGVYATDFADADLGDGAAILVGLERQISDRFKLISENYVLVPFFDDGSVAVGTLSGVRFFSDRLAADVAVALGGAEGEFSTIPIPYLGLSYTF